MSEGVVTGRDGHVSEIILLRGNVNAPPTLH